MSANLPLRNSCRNRLHAEGRTSAPTAFAVGDVRAGARHYLSDAIADGQRAAQAVIVALKKS
jgi:thioredoxin reductase (NADPH)